MELSLRNIVRGITLLRSILPKEENASDSMYITSVQRRNRRKCDGLVYYGLAEMMHVWSIERSVYPRSLLGMDAIEGWTSKGRESLNFVSSESFMRECFISRTLSLDSVELLLGSDVVMLADREAFVQLG